MKDCKWKLGDLNKSGTYLMPLLGGSASHYRDKRQGKTVRCNFVNCFVGDSDKPELDRHILLLYKFSGEKAYIDFEWWLHTHEYFRGSYEPDQYHTMYIFEVPNEYLEDYNKFKLGHYSKFSDKYKKQIETFYGLNGKDNSANPVIATLYRFEPGYIATENQLNAGLEPGHKNWLRIPRDQECSSKPEIEVGSELRFIEIYQPHLRVFKRALAASADEFDKINTNDE